MTNTIQQQLRTLHEHLSDIEREIVFALTKTEIQEAKFVKNNIVTQIEELEATLN